MDEYYQVEGLDRTHTVLIMLANLLGEVPGQTHPAIWNSRCSMLLETAQGALGALYQEIGAWDSRYNISLEAAQDVLDALYQENGTWKDKASVDQESKT